jgi:hypothetical protein
MKLRYIISRIIFLGLLICIINFIYTKYFWIPDLKEYAQMLPDLWYAEDSSDVIYFGESSEFNADLDSEKTSISGFTAQYVVRLHQDLRISD